MLYCAKCQTACPDAAKRCPACRNAKLRPVAGGDMVLLQWADMYTAQQVAQRLMEEGIPCETKSAGHAYFSFDNQSLPTDQNIYVPYAHLETARALAAQVSQQLEEPVMEDPGPPSAKHIVIEILSVAAFLALIALAALGTDALVGWLRSVF